MSFVILEKAVGAIALQLMLYFLPSTARVLLRPTRPSLAGLVGGENNHITGVRACTRACVCLCACTHVCVYVYSMCLFTCVYICMCYVHTK